MKPSSGILVKRAFKALFNIYLSIFNYLIAVVYCLSEKKSHDSVKSFAILSVQVRQVYLIITFLSIYLLN